MIGSPGLGKSRLADEFARSLAGSARVLVGHCEPSGEGITFLPVAEVLRDAGGIGDADLPEEVNAKLSAALGDEPDAERVVRRVAGVLGAGEPASAEETFWGCVACSRRLRKASRWSSCSTTSTGAAHVPRSRRAPG